MNATRFALSVTAIFCATFSNLFSQNSITILSPDNFLPHHLGEQFSRHDQLVDYFRYLAEYNKKTMVLQVYGKTNEERPLQIAIFSSEENLARLEQIRLNNLRLAGDEKGEATLENAPAIVWLSMSVHGNEPSGSECSMELAYRLATQNDPKIKEWLQNAVVIVDPSLNPDGYSRYTNWFRSVSNRIPNPNLDAREHREPWPGGRPNHYLFDLNRDWAWATQIETQQRLAVYHQWLPQVHADLHEQEINNPYYFAPAAEPMHDYITPWQREFQTEIGRNHARYFDQNGWLYFTHEVFDLFYPSYGDTYPMFNGAIGMTYEQAGHSKGGRAALMFSGDTLTLHDRILHHLTSSLSTIEIASKNASSLLKNFQTYYRDAVNKPQGKWISFVIREANDPNKVNALCQLLDRHRIHYGRVGVGMPSIKAFDYTSGKETNVSIQPNDVVISTFQPHGTLAQVLFEPESRLADSLTYDITSWALPYAYGLEAYALQQRIDPKFERPMYEANVIQTTDRVYAWCTHRGSLAEARWVGDLLQHGVRVRYATKAFEMADQKFEAGSYIVNRADNRDMDALLESTVKTAASTANVKLHPILSGWAGGKGADFGSEAYQLVKKPEVALIYSDDVDDNSFGHAWYFFEQDLGYPVTPFPVADLAKWTIRKYNTIIFPDGNYNLDESQINRLQEWVRQGGKIIAYDGGTKAFLEKTGFELKLKSAPEKKDSTGDEPFSFGSNERRDISNQIPGAIVKMKLDVTHPLCFGMSANYFSLKTNTNLYEMPKNMTAVAWIGSELNTSGFIGSKIRPRLHNSLGVAVNSKGSGTIIFFADNPLYRSFWYEGKVFFANALFF